MTAPLFLSLFLVAASLFGTRVLAAASWPARSPALGIVAWQALSAAAALAVVVAGLTLALPQMHLTADLARLVQACVEEMRHQYGTPAGALLSGAGAALAIGVAGRFAVLLTSSTLAARRHRRYHLARLALVAEPASARRFTVVKHDVPLVYCVPGRDKTVVVTTGATRLLTDRELEGVLAHERAHLRARHHLAIAAATALSQTFLNLGMFRLARDRIVELAEMHADDAASHEQRRGLASALLHLTGVAVPSGALGAGGCAAATRIVRLSKPQQPLPRRARVPILAAAAGLVLFPLILAMVPMGVALVADCCAALASR